MDAVIKRRLNQTLFEQKCETRSWGNNFGKNSCSWFKWLSLIGIIVFKLQTVKTKYRVNYI